MTSRIYTAVGEHRRIIRNVVCNATYPGSRHWTVQIHPEGYGSYPDPIIFARYDEEMGMVVHGEGYGTFRPEYAFRIAEWLTGTKEFVEA